MDHLGLYTLHDLSHSMPQCVNVNVKVIEKKNEQRGHTGN